MGVTAASLSRIIQHLGDSVFFSIMKSFVLDHVSWDPPEATLFRG